MTLFKTKKSAILKDSRWLQPLSDPPSGKPMHRSDDLETMAMYVSEIFKTGQARNLFICGSPGTGKTLCVKHLLSEIRRHAQANEKPIAPIYVNAGRTIKNYNTMLAIVKELDPSVPNAGWQLHRLKQTFMHILVEKAVIIGIDEVNILIKAEESLLYFLSRQPKTSLILVGEDASDIAELEDRVLSTLRPILMKLKPYNLKETLGILKQRAKRAFNPNVISGRLLKRVATHASEVGDIRSGFTVLLTAAIIAQNRGARKIEAENVDSAIRSEFVVKAIREIERLQKRLENTLKTTPSTFLDI